jgi:hypothetical protein
VRIPANSPSQTDALYTPWVDANANRRQPIMADEVQTFKALITVHKVLQEGHPIVLRDAQANMQWLDSLQRGTGGGDGLKGYGRLITEYVYYLQAKLAFHRQHPEFNGELLAHETLRGLTQDQARLNTRSTSVSSRSTTQTRVTRRSQI